MNYAINRAARKRMNLRTDEVIMIGDTMDTDMRGTTGPRSRSIFVLNGSTTVEALRDDPFAPAYIARSIAGVAGARGMMPLDAQ